ncbi:AlbA family DNA-binding domain-containing protein [Spirosoma jeollabukense]
MATSFAKIHIGKPLDDGINAEDLVTYFAVENDESLTLEFKSYYAKDKLSLDGILRTVAAFLNSEGGLLVFGAPHDIAVNDHYRTVKGDLTPIPSSITTKDSIIRAISDNISYMPTGIRVESVLMPGSGFVYLIEVQESSNKPHQYKKQYPVRLDGQSVAAPHYLVEALFKQERVSNLSLGIDLFPVVALANNTLYKSIINADMTINIESATPYDTDSNVYCSINLLAGSEGAFYPLYSGQRTSLDAKTLFIQKVADMVAYGLPASEKIRLEIPTIKGFCDNPFTRILILYGASNRPTKSVAYEIEYQLNSEFSHLQSVAIIRKEEIRDYKFE